MRYAVVTFGCRVNQGDSIRLEEQLIDAGGIQSAPEAADVVLVNTCSVTASADRSARQVVRRLAKSNPAVRILMTGCYATRCPDEVAELPQVFRVVGNNLKEQIPDLLASSMMGLSTADRFGKGDGACGAAIESSTLSRTFYTLGVQTGCNETCSYCIIPSTRGSGRSVLPDFVESRVTRAAELGYKEVALTGVHLGSYGRDLNPASSLFELLRLLSTHQAQLRFRISSLEPADCTPDIVDLVSSSRRFAPHFHLPLQHASDKVLRSMCRPYRLSDYRFIVELIRRRLPNAAIGSDVIVGFPGETDKDFQMMSSYLKKSPITYLHVFPYSDRPGTLSTTLGDKVSPSVIRDRARTIREIGADLTRRFWDSQVGTIRDGITLKRGRQVITDNYLKVSVESKQPGNEWVAVQITEAGNTLHGKIVNRTIN